MLKCLFATSYMDFISIVIEAKCSGCDKKMPYKNGRMPFGHQCGMLTFGMKTFLLNFRTKLLETCEERGWPGLGNEL